MALSEPPIFRAAAKQDIRGRFDEFLEWANPLGTAGITEVHKPGFRSDAPYFSWSTKLLGHGDKNTRSWLLKLEYLSQGRSVFRRGRGNEEPEVLNRNGLISAGRFLQFAKAYLNVISHYRVLRSPPKPTVYALILLEKALRDLNCGNNDPTNLNLRAFELATRLLSESKFGPGTMYDIGKDLEMLAGMVQAGFLSKNFRFDGKGFFLLDRPFAFSCGIRVAPRLRAITPGISARNDRKTKLLSSEDVAAVGLAYRKAVAMYGSKSPCAFMAAIAGIPLTTTSMRMSELVALRRDALYLSAEEGGRYRLRISRPKISAHQDLPLPRQLGELACELMECVRSYSADAHEALKFYVGRFGGGFHTIDELFIPERFRAIFSKQFMDVYDINAVFGTEADLLYHALPQPLCNRIVRFVNAPNDIAPGVALNARALVQVKDVEASLNNVSVEIHFPRSFEKHFFVSRSVVECYISRLNQRTREELDVVFSRCSIMGRYIRTIDIKNFLLADFKSSSFPHWPYITKERTTIISDALLVWFAPTADSRIASGEEKGLWWRPEPVGASSVNAWCNRYNMEAGILFKKLDIRLRDGTYPSLTLHRTRKYHHTRALLAGANEIFLDELAGRRTGRQSDHYDLRTPHELLVQSIETFDPDDDYKVIGPIAERAGKIRVSERKDFLFEHAAPKHVTEIGGCTTDWSINPCDQFGSCARCDKQVWRKGDTKRLQRIIDNRAHTLAMIKVGEQKMKASEPSHSLQRQVQQFREDLVRYDAILRVEANQSVELGTLVTFEAPDGAFGVSELTARLRDETMRTESTG